MLKTARRLHQLGFSPLWIKPKSKMPVENGWTKGPRKTWHELKKSYQKGFNIGTRLGLNFKEGYLAVVDCDVKSNEPHHLKELNDKLRELLSGETIEVKSGRGNGSKHLYIVTPKPVKPFRYSQSRDKVKVLMPSVKPSKSELKELTGKELAKGIRLRAAWEISIMGQGQQVVLPPSVHPDTGKQYTWNLKGATGYLRVDIKEPERKAIQDAENTFEVVPYDLYSSELSDELIAQIEDGEGVEDRSASVFTVVMQMLRCNFSVNEILTCLTDTDNFLSSVAYDHAQTKSRAKAARWLFKYTILKARDEVSLSGEFNDEVDDKVLSASDAKAQSLELFESDWKKRLQRNKDGTPKSSFFNIKLILSNIIDAPLLSFDEFMVEEKWEQDTPWGSTRGMAVSDKDVIRIKDFMAHRYRFEPAVEKVHEVLTQMASENAYHPVRGFLDALVWDGKPRVKTWLRTYLRAEGPGRYLEAVGSKTLLAMVARIYEPGVKFDSVLILEGEQGVGKSSTARILSEPWFSDSNLNIGDKDAVMNMQGIWVYELGELSAMNRSDTNQLKEFISRSNDKIRPPYGRRTLSFPRQSVFIGTTNNDEYLKDRTGNRRYWPVKVGKVKMKALKADREQLLAEAVQMYSEGEDLWIKDEAILKVVQAEQGLRVEYDELTSELGEFLNREDNGLPTPFRILDLVNLADCLTGLKNDRYLPNRLGAILRDLGYEKKTQRVGGVLAKFWVKK